MARDLRNSEFSRAFQQYLYDNVAQGNRREVTMEVFDMDGLQLSFRAKVRHRQIARVFGQEVTVYDVTTYLNGSVNVLAPDPSDLRVCSDTPFGGPQICLTIADLIRVFEAAGIAA